MTLIELLWFGFFLLNAAVAGMYGHRRFGWLGAIPCMIVGFLWCPAVLVSYKSFAEFWYLGRPYLPRCRQGRCHFGDGYRFDPNKECWKCLCGNQYVRRGRQFLERADDGSLRPYLKWKSFRGWYPDSRIDEVPKH